MAARRRIILSLFAAAVLAAPTVASKLLPSQGALVLAAQDRGDIRELCGDLELDADELEAAERWLLPYHETEDDPLDEDVDEYVEWTAEWARGWGLGRLSAFDGALAGPGPCGNFSNELLLLTVASDRTDGFRRFLRSAHIYNVPLQVLGMDQEWVGGDMSRPGGGYKVNLLKEELEKYKNDPKKIIMFTDAYDVIILSSVDRIVNQFRNLDARIVFSAEGFCWPDETLAVQYPPVARGKRFLNSGGFIGYAPELYELVTAGKVKDTDDDQLYYTKMYLDPDMRKRLNMKLDHRSTIFQNLHGALADVELRLEADRSYIKNTAYATIPLVLHGNGPSKSVANSLGNYIAKSWNLQDGCHSCNDDSIDLSKKKESQLPSVVVAIFIHEPTPFLEEFFQKIDKLDYPKSRIFLFVHNNMDIHTAEVQDFLKGKDKLYRSVKVIGVEDNIGNLQARELAMNYCVKKSCDAYLNVDSLAHLDNPKTLRLLLETNRKVVAPMLTRPFKAWSNFWGALSSDGFYARSTDYMEIVNNERRGLWNVPYISAAYLINATLFGKNKLLSYQHENLDLDMAFCYHLRSNGIFMFVSNLHDFGHLVNGDDFDVTKPNRDFFTLINNRYDWEQRYIHEDYASSLDPNHTPLQPCPDVYWMPIVSPRFCKDLVEIMEAFGKWSDGTNKDERLAGGYENVPTRDIHMNQVGFDAQWMTFLKSYIKPMVERIFTGYSNDDPRLDGGYEAVPTRDIHMKQVGLADLWDDFLEEYVQPLQQRVFLGHDDTPRSIMNFVVRYRPDEQPSLRPHHDSSTYTINLALNRPGIDYEGGGCHFIRYNCSVTNTRLGWLLMHPGRLTHLHEGLPVTNGTRYIMISFVDP